MPQLRWDDYYNPLGRFYLTCINLSTSAFCDRIYESNPKSPFTFSIIVVCTGIKTECCLQTNAWKLLKSDCPSRWMWGNSRDFSCDWAEKHSCYKQLTWSDLTPRLPTESEEEFSSSVVVSADEHFREQQADGQQWWSSIILESCASHRVVHHRLLS